MSSIAPLRMLSAVVPLSASLPDWTLLEPGDGTEPRCFSVNVTFDVPFSSPPVVQLGVVGVDASKEDNLRLKVRTEAITSTGFQLVASTWLNTRLWGVDVSWLAIGS